MQNSTKLKQKRVTPDSRGRITLGTEFTEGVSSFLIVPNPETGDIILKPYKEVPQHEAWLYENQEALSMVMSGLESAKKGDLHTIDLDSLE